VPARKVYDEIIKTGAERSALVPDSDPGARRRCRAPKKHSAAKEKSIGRAALAIERRCPSLASRWLLDREATAGARARKSRTLALILSLLLLLLALGCSSSRAATAKVPVDLCGGSDGGPCSVPLWFELPAVAQLRLTRPPRLPGRGSHWSFRLPGTGATAASSEGYTRSTRRRTSRLCHRLRRFGTNEHLSITSLDVYSADPSPGAQDDVEFLRQLIAKLARPTGPQFSKGTYSPVLLGAAMAERVGVELSGGLAPAIGFRSGGDRKNETNDASDRAQAAAPIFSV